MFDADFWDEHWQMENTPWDMEFVSPPLKEYFDQLTDKSIEILIPGAGNSWEAEYLWQNGFTHVDVLDISDLPLKKLKQRMPHIPETHFLHDDFFELNKKYDLIVEQTFFCALHPGQRRAYAEKMQNLLKPAGKLVGVLFDFPLDLQQERPPFGGSKEEYESYFKDLFTIKKLERCVNSHPKRQGRELFINLVK